MREATGQYPKTTVIEKFFFDAALATYAGGQTGVAMVKGKNPTLPGSKEYRLRLRWSEGEGNYDLEYVDTYFTNGEYSGGQTVIFYQDNLVAPEAQKMAPIWLMQYHGWCRNDDKGCLDFLKSILRRTYENKVFCGGRGQRNEISPPYFYENMWVGAFHRFVGKEVIHEGIGEAFWHRYHGELLIPADRYFLEAHLHPADLVSDLT